METTRSSHTLPGFPQKDLMLNANSLCSLLAMESSVQSVSQSCPTFCDPMIHSFPGLPAHHQLPEFTQTHVH